jgi:DNA-binding NtrC family response regulator
MSFAVDGLHKELIFIPMSTQQGKILIVDDDVDVLRAARLLLKRHFAQVDFEKNPQKIPYLVSNFEYDVILLDMNFTRDLSSGKEGFEWLDKILDINPKATVVLFTAYGDVEMAVRAIKAGAVDFVLKPWENLPWKPTSPNRRKKPAALPYIPITY